MSLPTAEMNAIARRATNLYSLPVIALEVVKLTNDPGVDSSRLTDCLEKDPALAAKVLRVVNSSLFGLGGQVSDLNQALTILGSKPLRLLVLGFSLPEELFAEARAEQLQWYWTTSLTRAVAARKLGESLWKGLGDEAFLAALLQDIGMLALLGQLDDAFAKLIGRAIRERLDLVKLERESLGFDHRQLSATMLRLWNLPETLVEAIETPRVPPRLMRLDTRSAEIAKVLHLAELLAQLVGQRRINVLPDLLETGKLYRGLGKEQLFGMVAELQPQVDQLAEVLSLKLAPDRNYYQVLGEAHNRLAEMAEEVAGVLARTSGEENQACDDLLHETNELRRAMQRFVREDEQRNDVPQAGANSESRQWNIGHAPHERPSVTLDGPDDIRSSHHDPQELMAHAAHVSRTAETQPLNELDVLRQRTLLAARGCRMRRSELSLVLLEVEFEPQLAAAAGEQAIEQVMQCLETSCWELASAGAEVIRLAPIRTALVIPDCDRRQAVHLSGEVIQQLQQLSESGNSTLTVSSTALNIGVATVTSVLKNFISDTLIEGAQRCLNASRAAGGTAIKSIEVY